MLASARRDGTSLRPRRDLYKKARWQPVVPEPRPAFIRTFLSIFRAGQKTPRNQFGRHTRARSRTPERFFFPMLVYALHIVNQKCQCAAICRMYRLITMIVVNIDVNIEDINLLLEC